MQRARQRTTAILVGLGLAGLTAAQSVDDGRLTVETWASGLTRPTQFAFIGDDDLLVFQWNSGEVHRVTHGTIGSVVLDVTISVGGGLGMVRDPDFESNGYIYVFYNASSTNDWEAWSDNRIERYTWNGSALVDPLLLISFPFDPGQAAVAHDSGALRFGPDGMLYAQVGDKSRGRFDNPRIEQNTDPATSAGVGAIMRLAPDGSIPADNPFANHANPALRPWYVYGFRNSLGFDFDLCSASLWFGENGPSDWDELNRAVAGMNSGWLKIMGPDARDAAYLENDFTAYDASDLVSLPGSIYRDPEFSWSECIGIAGMAFLHSKRFPEDLWDILLVGESNFGQLYRFDLDATRQHVVLSGDLADGVADDAAERDQARFGSGFGTTTQMQLGPDGYLYVANFWGGSIQRIRPLVDLFEPVLVSVTHGSLLNGGAPALERSDDVRMRLGSEPFPDPRAVRECIIEFTLNADVPGRVDLTFESRASSFGWQRIEIWDVAQSRWRTLDVRAIGDTDEVTQLLDLSSPTDLVDPSDRSLRLRTSAWGARVRHASPHGQASSGSGFRWSIDQARLHVTWP